MGGSCSFFFFQAEDGIRDYKVTGVQTCALPILVVAESQTAGRGRLGRTWLSPRGLNLYVSILLTRALPPETVTWTPMLAAVAVLRAIRALTTLNVRLKWPNDEIGRAHV